MKTTPIRPSFRRSAKRDERLVMRADPFEELLDQAGVAELTRLQISEMTCAELAQVVRVGALPFVRDDIRSHLDEYDRETLERLAYLARRACQNRAARHD